MPKYIDLNKQLVRLYRLNLTYEDVIKGFLLSAETIDVPERKVGKWTERKVIEDGKIIEQWQSAKCSVCGHYHTTPYMYYFDIFAYCPWCGAKMEMKGEDDATD